MLPSIHRLSLSRTIQWIIRQNNRQVNQIASIFSAPQRRSGETKFAVIASKAVGNSVRRNRAKRRVRAQLFNLLPNINRGQQVVIFTKKPALNLRTDKLYAQLQEGLKRLGLIKKA